MDYFILVLGFSAFSLTAGKIDTGKPEGYLTDCPGFNSTVTITAKTQALLTVAVFRSSREEAYHKTYRLRTAAQFIAKDPNVDFKSRRTVVFFDGYTSVPSIAPQQLAIAQAYTKRNYNVLIVDSVAVHLYIFPLAARFVKPIGILQGEFLAELMKVGLKPETLELLGISMGGHTMPFAANRFHQLTGMKPSRLTGLDPGGPCWRRHPEYNIRPELADNVDVLHTNIDGLGAAEPLGHVDFYANGGEFQPLSARGFILPCFMLCSHVHSFFYWWLSLDHPKAFVAIKCNSVQDARGAKCYDGENVTNVLGLDTDFNKTGIFYLPTTDSFPYYAGVKGLQNRYTPTSYLNDLVPSGDVVV